MNIKYINTLENRNRLHDELVKTSQFIEVKYSDNFKMDVIDASMNHSIVWVDLSSFDQDTYTKALEEIKSPEFESIACLMTIFVVLPLQPGPDPKPKPNPGLIPFEDIIDTHNIPYPNIDLIKVVKTYNLPWQAIYSEYFWTSISGNGNIALFGNKTYKLNEEDVVLFMLGSRYFGKVRYVFKFSDEESMRLQNAFKTITLLLHGLGNPAKLPISKAFDFVNNYNISSSFDLRKIQSYISDENGNLVIDSKKILDLASNISVPLKTLNFDYWLKAIIGRMTIEKHKNEFIAKYSLGVYNAAYHLFSGLEHSTDFVFVTLFELTDRKDFDDAFTKAQYFM